MTKRMTTVFRHGQPITATRTGTHPERNPFRTGTMTTETNDVSVREPHHFCIRNDNDDVIATAFADDGFVVLDQALEPSLLEEWHQFGSRHFEECFRVLYENGHTRAPTHFHDNEYVLGHGAKHGFREIVMRSPGRYELSLLGMINNDDKASLPEIQSLLQPLETLLSKLLNNTDDTTSRLLADLKLCHLSLLSSAPGSTDQGWHADGGHVNIQKHLPCHCYNIFLPLQDIPLEMGPTEFRPGGHFLTRNLGPMMLAAKCRKTLRPPVWPALELGDLAIFDYRVLHRGRANKTSTTRDVLVLTYCEPWFEDILNFPKRSMMEPPTTTMGDSS
jgi:hypothetical protein